MLIAEIRNAELTDIAAIIEIRTDPRVTPHQYRIANLQECYEEIVQTGRFQDAQDIRLTTIAFGKTIVGYVVHSHAEAGEVRMSQCGWSLHPDFWGQGLMTSALRQLLDELFLREKRTHVIADCFGGNTRCIRLLNRLGFVQWNYGVLDRLHGIYRHQSLKWVLRFGITADVWLQDPPNAVQ